MSFDSDFKKEINGIARALTKVKVNAVIATVGLLANQLTSEGELIGDPSEVGSPVWIGEYAFNHRVSVNDAPVDVVEFPRTRELVEDPVNLSASQLMARERKQLDLRKLKLSDTISIRNNSRIADYIETHGTKLIPEGGFYDRAGEYLESLLQRDFDSIVAVNVDNDGNTADYGD